MFFDRIVLDLLKDKSQFKIIFKSSPQKGVNCCKAEFSLFPEHALACTGKTVHEPVGLPAGIQTDPVRHFSLAGQ